MRRIPLWILCMSLMAVVPATAKTFDPSRIAPALGLDALTRGVARQQVGRDLFANPYASVTLGTVDVYDVFPYLESRTFEVVSDPRWNRIVYGEVGRSLKAYDGSGTALGPLSEPRGLAVDDRNRVYVADAGNNRVMVLEAVTSNADVQMVPLYEIRDLSHPFDVAWSDGGTPFEPGDDVLYVADTGRNRVVAFALGETGARAIAALGDLGSGPGRFAGPMSIAVGHDHGASSNDLYVADAHTRRIVRLRLDSTGLQWVAETSSDADVVTSLDTDRWGNLYAAAPRQGVVRKFTSDLLPVAELRGDLDQPKSFRIPSVTVRDHRHGTTSREAQPSAISLEQWSDARGMRLWNLGVDVTDLTVTPGATPAARFTLTDRADVSLELSDLATGRMLARRSVGTMDAGNHTLPLLGADLGAAAGASEVGIRIVAASSYANGPTASAQSAFRLDGGSVALPTRPLLLGSTPNPAVSFARIAFVLPSAGGADASLKVMDSMGRLVRRYGPPFAAGRNEVVWDGRDERGMRVTPGVYFYRLRVGGRDLTQRLVLVR